MEKKTSVPLKINNSSRTSWLFLETY